MLPTTSFTMRGKCKSLHGHTYHLQIAVSGFLDERGMTYDFGDIKAIYKNYLEPHLDHRYLNETLPYMNTLLKIWFTGFSKP